MPYLKKIYFLVYNVTPTNANEYFEVVEGALAHCWIKTYNAESALEIAESLCRARSYQPPLFSVAFSIELFLHSSTSRVYFAIIVVTSGWDHFVSDF